MCFACDLLIMKLNVFSLKGLPDQRQHTLQTTFPSLRTLMPPSTGSQSLWWTSNMNQKTLRAGISLHRSGIHPSKQQKCLIRSILHRIRPTVLWSISSKKEFGLGQVSFITHSFIGQALIFVSDRRLRRKTLKLTSPLWVLTRIGRLACKGRTTYSTNMVPLWNWQMIYMQAKIKSFSEFQSCCDGPKNVWPDGTLSNKVNAQCILMSR